VLECAGDVNDVVDGVDVERLNTVVAAVRVGLVPVDQRVPGGRHAIGIFDLDAEVVGRKRVVLVGTVVVVAGDDRVADRANRLGVADRGVLPDAGTGGDVGRS